MQLVWLSALEETSLLGESTKLLTCGEGEKEKEMFQLSRSNRGDACIHSVTFSDSDSALSS